jgi:hypothetical protein
MVCDRHRNIRHANVASRKRLQAPLAECQQAGKNSFNNALPEDLWSMGAVHTKCGTAGQPFGAKI